MPAPRIVEIRSVSDEMQILLAASEVDIDLGVERAVGIEATATEMLVSAHADEEAI